jgi:hypothetical protein
MKDSDLVVSIWSKDIQIVSILKQIVTGGKGKSKAIPLQALTRSEGSRRLRLQDFKKNGT